MAVHVCSLDVHVSVAPLTGNTISLRRVPAAIGGPALVRSLEATGERVRELGRCVVEEPRSSYRRRERAVTPDCHLGDDDLLTGIVWPDGKEPAVGVQPRTKTSTKTETFNRLVPLGETKNEKRVYTPPAPGDV